MKSRLIALAFLALSLAASVDTARASTYQAELPEPKSRPSYADYEKQSLSDISHLIAFYFWRYSPWEYNHMELLDRLYADLRLRYPQVPNPKWGELNIRYNWASQLRDKYGLEGSAATVPDVLTPLANDLTKNPYIVINDLSVYLSPYNEETNSFGILYVVLIDRDDKLAPKVFEGLRLAFINSEQLLRGTDKMRIRVDADKAKEIERIRAADPQNDANTLIVHLYGRVSHVAITDYDGPLKQGESYIVPQPPGIHPTMVLDVHRIDFLNARTGEVYTSLER
jgi:hypothetical protein